MASPGRILVAASRSALTPSSSSASSTILRASASGGANAHATLPSYQQKCTYSSLPNRSISSPNIQRSHQHQFSLHHYQQRYFARSTGRGSGGGTKRRGPPRNNSNNGNGGHQQFDRYSFDDIDTPRQESKNVLVIGSSGALGKTLVSHFGGDKFDWNVLGADVLDPEEAFSQSSGGLSDYIRLPKEGSLSDLTGELYRGVSIRLKGGETHKHKLDAIVCASGGWAGDVDIADMMEKHLVDANSSELEDVDYEEEYARESAEVCERMMRVNYHPIVAGGQVGKRFMKRGGLFCIIGASAALSPTSGMLGYGSAKSAAHHYLQSWGPKSSEENDITSVGILPLMIDTPANRAMLDGDDDEAGGRDDRYSKMVQPRHIANEVGEWINQPHLRPHSGSLVKVIAKNRRDGSGGAAFHLVR